jgi:F0F1-type ATP synthase membrane subunit b/b'
VAAARREAEREVERLRAAEGEGLDRALAEARSAVGVHAEELRARATRNLERAVNRALEVVVGEAP